MDSSPVNTFKLLVDAQEFLDDLLCEMDAAKRSIRIQIMCYEDDASSREITRMLFKKRNEGLDIRLLFDRYTDFYINDVFLLMPSLNVKKYAGALRERADTLRLYERFRAAGMQLKRTGRADVNPLSLYYRDHKKIIIIDESTAYMGGFNITAHNFHWHDFMVRMQGGIVREALRDFEGTWCGRDVHHRRGGTYLSNDPSEAVALIRKARSKLFLESPYLVGKHIIEEIAAAADRGVSVMIVMPEQNNKGIFQIITEYYKELFQEHGIKLFLYGGRMTHAKVLIVDDKLAMFGSYNYNEHWAHIIKEANVITDSADLIAQLNTRIAAKDIEESESASLPHGIKARIGKTFFHVIEDWFYARLF